eukprot:CAMPEP_0196721224 /NCGR_PEP_ID=MMETSP1091-20130531/3864_1 /TAXON_ID=302021 /ORGANISM="Rhodomonas sp., Strain CCMP768" /LENGTH=137 /DNA_ID=CAMNT_0042062657 /DNA_START=89 /DNA_END=498 /DNA_ORIENTATION=+
MLASSSCGAEPAAHEGGADSDGEGEEEGVQEERQHVRERERPQQTQNGEEQHGGDECGDVTDATPVHTPRPEQLEGHPDSEGRDWEFNGRRRNRLPRGFSMLRNRVCKNQAAPDEVNEEEGKETEAKKSKQRITIRS